MMFPPSDKPRVIGVPPGADFVRTLFDRLTATYDDHPPEAQAQVQILVATRRMQRRLKTLFEDDAKPRLLPRIHVVTDVAPLIPGADLPAPVSTFRRSLELKALVARLVDMDDRLSPVSVVDLTDSIARLLDEMQSEGVPLEALDSLNSDDASGHWQQSLTFLRTIRDYVAALAEGTADAETAKRVAVEALCDQWQARPPQTPVIVAGSTGSRATTHALMLAAAHLPQGAVLLPGYDFDLPAEIWETLAADRSGEDHPQYRFAAFLRALGLSHSDVTQWGTAPSESRNRLISLSLRPPSVTDQWLQEGPELGDLDVITNDLTLLEAPESRDESLAIAAAIRHAIDRGESIALIAPDATLSRRVTAALDRWGIRPDDSAGMPLTLTPPGRLLRQIANMVGRPVDPVDLFALLKHPLTKDGERGEHKLSIQRFEAFVRRSAVVEIDATLVDRFTATSDQDRDWADWLKPILAQLAARPEDTLSDALDHHLSIALALTNEDALWSHEGGEKIRTILESFRAETDFGGPVSFAEYARFLDRALSADTQREDRGIRPDVSIWGTLEARVQGADTVILGGLNEGTWPEEPAPDPWLNRRMRREIGLLLPERQIGLAAHDYQQAIGAPRVILSRARRSDGTETVPSRWLNRLTNLLQGLPGGEDALNAMTERGARYLAAVRHLDQPETPVNPAPRPAPAPPIARRPRDFAVTQIKTLIRDPYAIYARRILRLKPLDPLVPEADARLRGTVLHRILEHSFTTDTDPSDPEALARTLEAIARRELDTLVPWPAIRAEWLADILRNTEWLVTTERQRLANATPVAREVKGSFTLPTTMFTIRAEADRIDRLTSGELVIYDYKTGSAPDTKEVRHFDRQLPIEAAMAEAGAFVGISPTPVSHVVHIDVGRSPEENRTDLTEENETVTVTGHLAELLTDFLNPFHGYVSRRAMEKMRYDGDYDHLARFGEWSDADDAEVEPLP